MKRTSKRRVTSIAVVVALGLATTSAPRVAAASSGWSIAFTGTLAGDARSIEPECLVTEDAGGPVLARASFRLGGRRLTLSALFAPPVVPGTRTFGTTPDAATVVVAVGVEGAPRVVATGSVGTAVVAEDGRSGMLQGTLVGPDGASELSATFECPPVRAATGRTPDGDGTADGDVDHAPDYEGPVVATVNGSSCTGSEDGTILLFGGRGGRIFGGILADGSYTCEGIVVPTSGAVILDGHKRGDRLVLDVAELDGLLLPTWNCMVDQRLTIPLRHGAGRATPAVEAPSGDRYECTIEVRRG